MGMYEKHQEWVREWQKPDYGRRFRLWLQEKLKPKKFSSDADERGWLAARFEILGPMGFWSPEWKKEICLSLNRRLQELDGQREATLAAEYPELWRKYQSFCCDWACAGIYLLERPTFERWMEGMNAKVKDSVTGMIRAAEDHFSK